MVVVAGRPSLAEDGALVADAVQVLAGALPDARFLPALRRGNVHGALDMGLAPGLLPGRVGLEDGREWFTRAWGSVPSARGRDALGILRAAAGGTDAGPPVRSLVLLGADPLADFPDRRLAERALDGAEFVVAVASSPGPVVEHADVVLPAAEAHERPGTTTNIEGRVSRLGQKLVPPGQAWPDWMIAAELAVHLGADLGLDSVGEVWDEMERVAPAYRGITRAVLDAPGAADGVVAPLAVTGVSVGRRGAPQPLDPIAVPGVESVERQGAPPRAGLAESPTAAVGSDLPEGGDGDRPAASPPLLGGTVDLEVPHLTPVDSYSLRLVASRVLYDLGSAVERRAGAGRSGARRPVAGEPPRPRRPGDRSRGNGPAAQPVLVPGGDGGARPIAAPQGGGRRIQCSLRRGDRRRPHRRRLPGGRGADGDTMSHLALSVHSLLAAGDPLYANGVDWAVFLIVLIKVLVVFGALMVSVMLMIWFERKVISDMQSRIGPNRAGPFGIAQTLADGIKLFFKEDLIPDRADRVVFKLAPYLTIIPAFLIFAIVPIGGEVTIAGPHLRTAVGRPADGDPVPAGHVLDRGLRDHAGRVVLGFEVPAARLGAGLAPR